MKIRITYRNKKELDAIIDTLKTNHKVTSISEPYKNLRTRAIDEYRVYVELEL